MSPSPQQGSTRISPVLVVASVEEEVAFLQNVFRAEIGMLVHNAQGEAQHAEAAIGDSILFLERATATHPATCSVLRIPMTDVQATRQLAVDYGGETDLWPGSDLQQYGGVAVSDPQGNVWWIVPQDRKPSNEEVQRRLNEQRRQRL
jgi:uncharacterized glyoxalase superfamily protein PhnB